MLNRSKLPYISAVASIILLVGFQLPGTSAYATTGKEYVSLRSRDHCDCNLTYDAVKSDPGKYVGKVIELSGRVGGTISTSNSLSVMLNLTDDSAPTIDIPTRDISTVEELPNACLRVLVQVAESGNGNLVHFNVLAVAHETDVSDLERQAAQRQAAVRAAAQAKQDEQQRWAETARHAVRSATASQVASRGDFQRFTPEGIGDLTAGLSPRARPLFGPYFSYISKCNTRLSNSQVGQITYHLLNFADRFQVDPRLVVSMIIAESDFNPNSTSSSGAIGLGQLMPSTARDMGVSNPYDPIQNLGGSIAYLRGQLDTFSDHSLPGGEMTFEQAALAMAAYNAGPNAVKKYHGIPPYRETQAYVRRVMTTYQQLCR